MEKAGLEEEEDSDAELFKDLFLRMVNPKPENRPSIGEILDSTWFEY